MRHTDFSVVVEVLNEGLPRAAWYTLSLIGKHLPFSDTWRFRSTIGKGDTTRDTREKHLDRLNLILTLISFQSILGFLLSIIFLFAAPGFVGAFVPGPVRETSVKYIRILAFDALASTLNVAVSFGTRAMDKPE